MHEVKVNKNELLAIIRKNRDNHRDVFLKAQAAYRARVIEELDRMLDDARGGRKIRVVVSLPEPTDHTGDYDRAIRMLEMSVDVELTIDAGLFQNFVMDEWGWKAKFSDTVSSYGLRA